jgi:hypothetical protein
VGVLPFSAHGGARCAATHFDAARHNFGAVQHFIRAARFVTLPVSPAIDGIVAVPTCAAAVWPGYCV